MAENKSWQRFGEFLVANGYINQIQLDIALHEQAVNGKGMRLGNILLGLHFMRREDLYSALNKYNPDLLSSEGHVQTRLPDSLLYKLQTITTGENEDTIFIATLHHDVAMVISELSKHTPKTIEITRAPVKQILNYLSNLGQTLQDLKSEDDNPLQVKEHIIQQGLEMGASDIHIESGEDTVFVRYRIDGILHHYKSYSKTIGKPLYAMIKNESNMDSSETRIPQDGSFSRAVRERFIDFRVATIPTEFGEKITMRVLDKEKSLLPLSMLGITHLEEYRKMIRHADGLVVIVGATGSGKSTTLYSTVLELDRVGKAIYTIEEPVEYRVPFINQVQVNRKTQLDFARALRSFLRHDPDIIIVGEVRDKETAEISMYASKTGHLVFVTLHANDVRTAVTRLKELGYDSNDLRYSLRGIVSQKLIRRFCRTCGGKGCDLCFKTGYRGRTLLTEVKSIQTEEEYFKLVEGETEYATFLDDARLKLEAGITGPDEIERVLGAVPEWRAPHVQD